MGRKRRFFPPPVLLVVLLAFAVHACNSRRLLMAAESAPVHRPHSSEVNKECSNDRPYVDYISEWYFLTCCSDLLEVKCAHSFLHTFSIQTSACLYKSLVRLHWERNLNVTANNLTLHEMILIASTLWDAAYFISYTYTNIHCISLYRLTHTHTWTGEKKEEEEE